MRTCETCMRWHEDARYLREHGIKPRARKRFLDLYCAKPRTGIKTVCTVDRKRVRAERAACGAYVSRRRWNAHMWFRWHFVFKLSGLCRRFIRVPLGGMRKPQALLYQDGYNFEQDKIVPNYELVCPHCGEMPYSTERCVFCGQRFTEEV